MDPWGESLNFIVVCGYQLKARGSRSEGGGIRREASGSVSDEGTEAIAATFVIGVFRVFDQDPRFGLLVPSEIASRTLSPAVNHPGTAIDFTGTLVRLFVWLLKALESLAPAEYAAMHDKALRHARLALVRAENALKVSDDLTAVREVAKFVV